MKRRVIIPTAPPAPLLSVHTASAPPGPLAFLGAPVLSGLLLSLPSHRSHFALPVPSMVGSHKVEEQVGIMKRKVKIL